MAGNLLSMVLEAIQVLYCMKGAARQREANEFLNNFAASDAAWGVGFQLLQDETLALPPEALFFAANMLHTKVRKDWIRLSVKEKSGYMTSIQTGIKVMQTGYRSSSYQRPLANKLCAIYAVAMISSPDDCRTLFSHMLTSCLTSGNVREIGFLLAFSRSICEEMEGAEIDFATKDAMERHLFVLSGDLVAFIGKIVLFRKNNSSEPLFALCGEALACLNVWVRRAGLSLVTLYCKDKALLLELLEILQTTSRHLQICAEILTKLTLITAYPTPAQLEPTLLVVAQGLLGTRGACESAVGAGEEETSHALTNVISTFCETFAEWILEGTHPREATALGELMLYLGSQPRRQIASLTLEFWLAVQDVPVASRLDFYQHDAFIHLFDVMLKQCSFPPGYVENMDDLEHDDLDAFRNGFQGVSDVFKAIFMLIKAQYLSHLLPILTSAELSKWQSVEVALFAVSTTADDIKKILPDTSTSTLQQAELENTVLQMFQTILCSTVNAHPLVITMASRLLGQFAGWLNNRAVAAGASDTIETVFRYLTSALRMKLSCIHAAKSFLQVAMSCRGYFVEMQPGTLVASMQYFGGPFGHEIMPIEGQLLVVEGIVRVAAISANCFVILQTVLNNSLSRLDQVLASTGCEGVALSTLVCNELQVLSKTIRFLDTPNDAAGGKAVTKWAVQQIWSHLDIVALRFEMDEAAITALFELYGWCLQNVRQDMAPQLGGIATLIMKVFEERHFAAPLKCASVAVDVFGQNATAEIVDSFRGLMGTLSQSAFHFFTTHSLAESPDILRSFFELAYRFLLFCPAAVLTAAEFPMLVELGLACIGNQDRASTNAILMFLTFLLNESTNKLAAFAAVINAIVLNAGQTEKWLDNLVGALAVKSPSALYDSLSKLFYALLTGFTGNERVQGTLRQSLTRDRLGVAVLQPNDRQQVLHLWLALAAEPSRYSERRFRGLCSDFAKVCRRELTADTFYSIELPK